MTEFALFTYAEKRAALPGIKVGAHVLPVAAGLKAGKRSKPDFAAGSTKEILHPGRTPSARCRSWPRASGRS